MATTFAKGTAILLISSILLKIIGFGYQIFIIRTIGTEAIGIVNMVHPFYMALVIFATLSMPLAISRMVAKELAHPTCSNITKIMHRAFLLVGILVVLALFIASVWMPKLFSAINSDSRLRWCFYMLIPGILIVPFTSVLRGYFQGKRKMLAPSIGQITEQIVRVLVGAGAIILLQGEDVLYLAMGLSGAMMAGELAGFLILLLLYFIERKRTKYDFADAPANSSSTTPSVFGEMLSLGIPATLTKLTSTADMMIEAWLMPWSFWQSGASRSTAAKLYGDLSGVAFHFLSIPTILTGALSSMLIPTVANHAEKRDSALGRSCAKVLALTYMISCPVIVVCYFLGEELIQLIFAMEGLGHVVQDLCFGAMFIYLGQTAVGILQGLGKNKQVFYNNFCGSFLKTAGIWYFVYYKSMGMNGAAWGFVLGYGGQCMLHLLCLAKAVPLKFSYREIILPPVLSALFAHLLSPTIQLLSCFPHPVAIIGAIFLNTVVYLVLLKTTNTFSLQLFQD